MGDNARADAGTQQSQDAPPSTLENIQERIATTLKSIYDASDAKEEKERQRRDLDAQENMAHWARWMFWATFAQAIIGAVGVFAVLKTLKLNREAVAAANRAADHASGAVEIAEHTSIIQLRAYVYPIIGKHPTPGAGERLIVMNLKNSGNTPAYDVVCDAHAEVLDEPVEMPKLVRIRNETQTFATIPPGEIAPSIAIKAVVAHSDAAIINKDGADKRLYFWGTIKYKIGFGRTKQRERRVTKFRYVLERTNDDSWRLQQCREGNDSD